MKISCEEKVKTQNDYKTSAFLRGGIKYIIVLNNLRGKRISILLIVSTLLTHSI